MKRKDLIEYLKEPSEAPNFVIVILSLLVMIYSTIGLFHMFGF